MRLTLNCDLAELPTIDDECFMPWLDIANIACAGHAGSVAQMQRAVALAKQYRVAVCAHPGYPDRPNFGRLVLPMTLAALQQTVLQQVQQLAAICQQQQLELAYLKPHGALYHQMLQQPAVYRALLALLQQHFPQVILIIQALPSYQWYQQQAAEFAITLCFEAFADRGYLANGQLMARTTAGALVSDPEFICTRISTYLTEGKWLCQTGQSLSFPINTLCVHSDSPNSVAMVKKIRAIL